MPQQAFTVLSRLGPKDVLPPMTSRQAHQRYQQRSGPRVSMEEQRRLERQEEERIREEKDAERSKIRSKAARDRKKAKEERERLERKTSGLPIADCRQSQGLISGFVRGNERGEKRMLNQDESGEKSGGEHAAKRRKTPSSSQPRSSQPRSQKHRKLEILRDGNVKRKSNGWNSAKSHPSPPPEEVRSQSTIRTSQQCREPKDDLSEEGVLYLLINEGEMSSQEWLNSDPAFACGERFLGSPASQRHRAERSHESRAAHATTTTEMPGTELQTELEAYDWDKFSQDF